MSTKLFRMLFTLTLPAAVFAFAGIQNTLVVGCRYHAYGPHRKS